MHVWVREGALHRLSLGRQFALVREHLGLSVDELVRRTRLSHRIVAAIETSDYAALGARVFAMGAIRSYAQAVGYGVSEAIDELLAERQWLWGDNDDDSPANLKPRRSFWGKRGHISVMGL